MREMKTTLYLFIEKGMKIHRYVDGLFLTAVQDRSIEYIKRKLNKKSHLQHVREPKRVFGLDSQMVLGWLSVDVANRIDRKFTIRYGHGKSRT